MPQIFHGYTGTVDTQGHLLMRRLIYYSLYQLLHSGIKRERKRERIKKTQKEPHHSHNAKKEVFLILFSKRQVLCSWNATRWSVFLWNNGIIVLYKMTRTETSSIRSPPQYKVTDFEAVLFIQNRNKDILESFTSMPLSSFHKRFRYTIS